MSAQSFQTYQWMLRALGAILDREPSCRISIVEAPNHFIVRLQHAVHKLDPIVREFDHASLVEVSRDLVERRNHSNEHCNHQGVWRHFPHGHQDFLRALGYELDDAGASNILIDELDDGMMMTYSAMDSDQQKVVKRFVLLELPHIEEVLNAAFERRARPAHVE